ncbi:MAG: carboxypeptidase regulatory-like domain-containing protein [Bryobacterales bacterium]|nr:carboxypeptidase regulatory-like domain-containing protein [Bryobacterales bacterium]
MSFKNLLIFLTLVCLLAATGFAQSQDARGNIVGRVTDSTGAVVPGADVRARSIATGVSVVSKANEGGNYVLPFLMPGFYEVTSEFTGFRKFVRANVQVRVNENVELNIEMTIGDVTESVNVTAETPLLQTAEASLGQIVDERRIMELPLFAGNAMDLVHLAPGTVNGTDMRLRKAPFNNAPSQFSTDGTGNYGNSFTIDGVANIYSDGTSPRVAFSPPQASLSEFKVQTSSFDSAIGRTMGSLVNVSTKGGTNDLHGTAWWWLRHSAFDAPTIYQNRAGLKLPVYRDNRYGLAGGGPVFIPKVYNGKNKTFWFFTWEANKFGDPNVGGSMISTVPSAPWRNGDLSDLLKAGANYQLYDPATIATASGGRFSRQPLPNNIFPASRIDPVAKRLLALWPLPNQTGTADGRNNFFYSLPAKENYWTTIGRVDHAFSEKNRMFVRWHRDFWEEDKNRSFGNDVNGVILNRVNRGIAIDDVHMLTSTMVLNFRYGIAAQEFPERRVSKGFDLSSLGFSSALTGLVDKSLATIPRTAVGSLTALSGWESGDGVTSSISHNLVASATWIKGNHNVRFGLDFMAFREFRNRYPNQVSPDFSFSNLWARGEFDTSAAPPVGAEFIALLAGIPGGSMALNGSYAEQDLYYGLHFQDDWKVSRKLTLNLGMRAEIETPITERFNRSVTQFDGTTANPIEAAAIANYTRNPIPELAVSAFQVKGGVTFAGVGGNSRNYWDNQGVQWNPRLGFAYQLTPKTVLRGGYGIFFSPNGILRTNSIQAGFSQSTPIVASTDSGLTFITSLANPLPTGLLPVRGAAGGLITTLGQGTSGFAKDRSAAYAQRASFGFQRELPMGFVTEASYVGNRSTRLPISRSVSFTPRQFLSTSPVRDQATIDFLGRNFTSPFFGLNPQFTSANISRGQLLTAYPHFSGVSFEDPVGYAWYHSLQARTERRFKQGFTLQLSYTWSKAMDATTFLNAQDPMPYESLSDIDRTHRITGSGIYELPFGKGRPYATNMHPLLNFFAGGWQITGVMQRQSGGPLGFGQALFTGNSADIVLASPNRNTDRWFNTDVFYKDTRGQLGSNIRNAPLRYSNIRTDSQRRWDFSANKTFTLTEKLKMVFRADTFNALNEVVLRGPNTDPYNSAFGRVTAQEPPRSWQFSLTLKF